MAMNAVPCGCIEHVCNPSPTQTERYEAAEGLFLCAACYTLGHMPMAGTDPVLREYYESIRRVMDREARA